MRGPVFDLRIDLRNVAGGLMGACSHCGQTMPEDDPVARLRNWCRDNGHWLSPDDRVKVDTAAEILGQSPFTLRNWRYDSIGPRYYRRARSPVTYQLYDLAEYLENQRTK